MAVVSKSDLNVLVRLQRIFARSNSDEEDAVLSELRLLRNSCDNFVQVERRRVTEVADTLPKIFVRKCEFAKLQFPKSQLDRCPLSIPVRLVRKLILCS